MVFETLNALGKQREPFLFVSDFKAQRVEVFLLKDLAKNDIEFCINSEYTFKKHTEYFEKKPLSFVEYKKKFDKIIENIESGNTYITNLTQATPVQSPLHLDAMFRLANAHYKIRFKEEFVCFSPETFVQIADNHIHTFPMKGTIDASIPNAKEKILADKKELAEHIMVVDLLRNDLSIVAEDIKVVDFRVVSEVEAGAKNLLQVSSHIQGRLQEDWHEEIGDILRKLLPAGSISGTPKKSTLEIIEQVEGYTRGFYSGVFGVYDGKKLDSGVMIRFVEKTPDGYIYKSGGGITLESDAHSEYQEMLDKIYLP